MKYFPFNELHDNAFKWFHGKYFPFHDLDAMLYEVEQLFLFGIISFLVYIWVQLFLYWDKR